MPKVLANGEEVGIECGSEQMAAGLCTLSVDKLLGHKEGQQDTDVNTMLQDITFSATFFIGTVLVITFLYSGFLYITAKDDGAATKAKNGFRWGIIGLLLVIGAYAIIRLVQYVAKG